MLSDWNGEAARAFGIAFEPLGMSDVAARASFLIEDGATVRASWMHGPDLPNIDEMIAVAGAP